MKNVHLIQRAYIYFARNRAHIVAGRIALG